MWLPARRSDAEWLDREDSPPKALRCALRDIGRVNRFLGGRRALLRALSPIVRSHPNGATLEVLDVGTGGADLPLALIRFGRATGRRIRVTALDRNAAVAGIAARAVENHPEIQLVRADARRLPFGPRSFDVVTSSMFLHHFEEGDVAELLRGFRRTARRAVVVNDLRRHRLPWAFIALAARITLRHPMFAHDAALSVLRGFTTEELYRAGREAGAAAPSVERSWPFRLLMTLRVEEDAA